MGKLTNEPFTPSCCDGGFGSNANSCQPCGCDPGENDYKCERHRAIQQTSQSEEVSVTTATVTTEPTVQTVGGSASGSSKDAKWRKERPLWSGVLRYFPDALLEVAHVSYVGNEQHNPGQPLHWDRSKSKDEGDACARHLSEAGTRDTDGTRHSAKAAWRALALLQKEIEAENDPSA